MDNRARAHILLCLSLLAASPVLRAQTASLVKDINPDRFFFAGRLGPDELWAVNGKVIFSAHEPSSGRELWVSDGTGSGTRLLADFRPGKASSYPQILGAAGGLLYGITSELDLCCLSAQTYLWRSDGTQEGTFLLPDPTFQVSVDFNTEDRALGENPVPIAFDGAGAYFIGCTSIDVYECGLWRTDGTQAGTRRLRQLPASANPVIEPTLAAGRVFFSAERQLWTSDGTTEGTVMVREFFTGIPRRLVALGDKVLFLLQNPFSFRDGLWVSDGTTEGTRELTNFENPKPFQQANFLKVFDGKAYFVADDGVHGVELWASDGTAAGTLRVTDFSFDEPLRDPDDRFDPGLLSRAITKHNGRLLFWARDGSAGSRLWSSQGTPGSETPLCSDCTFHDEQPDFVPLQGKLLFRAADHRGAELWTTDGTAAGTRLLADVCPGSCDGVDLRLASVAGALFFQGPSTSSQGSSRALWRTDGTRAGTRLFAETQPFELSFWKRTLPVASLGREIIVSALYDRDDPHAGGELWVSDGTSPGTRRLSTNGPLGGHSNPRDLIGVGDQVYFTASDTGFLRNFVWRSRGTEASTQQTPEPVLLGLGNPRRLITVGGTVFLVEDDAPAGGGAFPISALGNQLSRVHADGRIERLTNFPATTHRISDPVSFQGHLFFAVSPKDGSPAELWKSVGTPQGTGPAVGLPAELSGLGFLEVAGGRLWFLGVQPTDPGSANRGFEIWVTDGTAAGARRVLDGLVETAFGPGFTDPDFTQVDSAVYFVAPGTGIQGSDLRVWKSDGSPQGTTVVVDQAFPAELTAWQGDLYFLADLSPDRRGLWRLGATPGAPELVHDFVRPRTTFPELPPAGILTALGNRLVFTADEGVHGQELWRYDSPSGGIALLRDINPGLGSSQVTSLREAAGKLYFSATDGAHGFEPWQTDGTPEGTRLIQDIAPQGGSSHPAGFTVVGDRLYFSADDGLTGSELWTLPLSGPACQPSATVLCLNGGRFRVEARWRIPSGVDSLTDGVGQAAPLSTDTGTFWFFDSNNVEAILKVLDGRGVNGHFWVFYGALSDVEYALTVTDTQTGLAHRYFNSQGQLASVGDTRAFGPQGVHETKLAVPAGTNGASGAPRFVAERFDTAKVTATCIPNGDRLCLNGGRFAVETTWKDFENRTGKGTAVSLTGDTGYFWFFNAANVEAVVKVLDGTAVNGRYWLFYGALSNVEYTLTVTDTMTGQVKTYKNPLGNFGSVADTAAF